MDTYTLIKGNSSQNFDTLRELIDAANRDSDDGQTRRYYRNEEPFSDADYTAMEAEQRRMVSESAAALGRHKSERKTAAARANGRKGGRPRKTALAE